MPIPPGFVKQQKPRWKQPTSQVSIAKDKELIGIARKKEDLPVELESQIILRLPLVPAQELKKALRSGAMNVKDRLSIQLEPDMRHSIVRLDNWAFPAKLHDLPCVSESLKTIDKKTFYKTADLSQMLVCKEEDDSQTTEDEDSPKKKEEKDRTKADKKFLWPHGITPSLKNVRKRRFRKTLKKKYVDAPEIEKEVKRLFRVDNEAVSVRWEVITDEEDMMGKKPLMGESQTSSAASPAASGPLLSNSQSLDVAEHDIFGEEVSSSEDEQDVNIMDSGDDESSRLSIGMSVQDVKQTKRDLVTEFTKEMLKGECSRAEKGLKERYSDSQDHIITALEDAGLVKQALGLGDDEREALLEKLDNLNQELLDVQARRQAQELEISSIDNQALKQRFQSVLEELIDEENDKQRQYTEVASLLNR